jgi:hypothetical protein
VGNFVPAFKPSSNPGHRLGESQVVRNWLAGQVRRLCHTILVQKRGQGFRA